MIVGRSISLFLLLVFFLQTIGQNITKINELKYNVQIEDNTNTRIDQLLELSELYQDYDNEIAINYALEALTLSKGLHYNKGKINAYLQIGKLEKLRGNFSKAVESYEYGIEIYESYGDQKGAAIGNILIGDVFLAKSEFESARVYYQYGLDLGEKIKSNLVKALANDVFGN